jgi:hypothetical protein
MRGERFRGGEVSGEIELWSTVVGCIGDIESVGTKRSAELVLLLDKRIKMVHIR